MRFSTGLLLGAVATLAVAAAGWWTVWSSSSTGRADPGDVRQVAHGEVVYQLHCASSHGAKLEGQPNWQIRTANPTTDCRRRRMTKVAIRGITQMTCCSGSPSTA